VAQIVTLLSADLAGSDAPQHQGDDGREHTGRDHFSLLRKVVKDSGGEEVGVGGAGLMVVFSSAVGAVRCAVAMQEAIRDHTASAGPGAGRRLEVRIGLHVGEPVQDGDDYFGMPLLVARGLCAAAGDGQILASGLVRGLVASRAGFTFRPVSGLVVTGASEAVEGFEVVWGSPARGVSSVRVVDGRRLPLVGREPELNQLEDELSWARDERLRAVLIVGEPGVGKTRLATELADRHVGEVLTLRARAYPLGATASLGLWAEGLERHLRGLPRADVLRLCAGDLDDLTVLLPSARAAKGGGQISEPPRIRLLGALARLLSRLSEEKPVVIVLDDVHLADGSSWEALNYLTRNLVDCRILLLLAARPTELAEDRIANDVLLGLEQEGLLRRLQVTALADANIRELAESVIGGEVPDALVEWLMRRSMGSPLFAVGLLRALVDENADLEHPTLRALPENLAERVESRLRELDAAARAALELMTVVGYRAELSDLVRLSGKPLGELAPILDRLVRVHLVSEIEDGHDLSYEIDHPLIQEAIYRSLGGARRRALHWHAARVLVEAGRFGAAAPHFVRAAEPGDDEAIEGLCEALRQAEAREHHREALALLDALFELVPAGDHRWQRVLGAMPLQPEWVIDHRADARAEIGVRAMRAIEQVMERSSDSTAQAAVKFNLGSLLAWAMGEIGEGHRLVREALSLFEAGGEARQALLCANELGYLAALAGDISDHEAQARAVLGTGVEKADHHVELQALCSLAWVHFVAGQLESAGPLVERAVAVARDSDKNYRFTYLVAAQGWVAAQLGRMDEARSLLADAVAGNPAFRDTYLLDFTAAVDWLAGDLHRVVSAFRDQLAWTGGISRRRAVGGAHAAMALTEMGRHGEAADVCSSVAAAFAGREWWVHSDLARWAEGASASLRGGKGEGLSILHATVGRMTDLGFWNWARFALADLAESAAELVDGAVGSYADRLATSDPWLPDAESQHALQCFTRGAAALAQRENQTSATMLEVAAEGFAHVGWPLFAGRALTLLGQARAEHDRDRAVESLQAALDYFDGCGAIVRRERALTALGRLGTKGRRTKTAITGPGALTRREHEVARLAAEGCSAKEMAERLFIGERTVETHLANVYAKLGVASKVELVRMAAQLEL
jgi:DNA-binding CsgD family transcriptional regulator/class 3 adenylate cyclase